MYLTPIFYPLSQLPQDLQNLIKTYNPLYYYLQQFRIVVLENRFPEPKLIAYGYLISFVILIISSIVFMKNQNKFILYI